MTFSTVNFSDSEEGLFTPDEILQLMQVEYDRARRYGYSASIMMVAVDRLEYLHDLYGWESKEEILQAVIRALRSCTRDSDYLGCMQDDRILVVFPHTTEETMAIIATRMLRVCRELDFRATGRSLRATVSIGAASLRENRILDFAGFVDTAAEAVAYAILSGGDRFVRRESATEVISDLREEIEAEAQKLFDEHQLMLEKVEAEPQGEALPTAPAVPTIVDLPDTDIGDRLRAIFREHGRTHEMIPLEDEVVSVAEELLHATRDAAVHQTVADHQRNIDVLERRVSKLKELLDTTEKEMAEIAAVKGVDSGIASIYRTVQGLSGEEKQFTQKKEMLSLIFEANVDLKREMEKKKRGS